MSEIMSFTRHDDGTVTVDRFVDDTWFSIELLRKANPAFVQYDGDIVTITAANGTARYRIVERDPYYPVVRALRESTMPSEAP
jgi:hypothetical protein